MVTPPIVVTTILSIQWSEIHSLLLLAPVAKYLICSSIQWTTYLENFLLLSCKVKQKDGRGIAA